MSSLFRRTQELWIHLYNLDCAKLYACSGKNNRRDQTILYRILKTAVVLVSHKLPFQIVPSSKNKIWIKLRLKFNEFIYDICVFVCVCVWCAYHLHKEDKESKRKLTTFHQNLFKIQRIDSSLTLISIRN